MKTFISIFLLCVASISLAQPPRPKFSINPTSLNFNTVTIGDSADKTFNMIADSTAPNTVIATIGSPQTSFYTIIGQTIDTIAKGKVVTVRLRFKPTAVGQVNDTLYISHNGDTTTAKNPTRITMRGIGAEPDTNVRIGINPNQVQFNLTNVGQSATKTVLISNSSQVAKTLTGSAAIKNASSVFSIVSGSTFSLTQNKVDTLVISFTPTAGGIFSEKLTISSNAGKTGNSDTVITLNGFAFAPDTLPRMTVVLPQGSFNNLNYGQVAIGKAVEQTVKLINTSDSTIKGNLVGSSSLLKVKQYSIINGGGSFTLARRDTQTVVIRFIADTTGAIRDTLLITNNSSNPITKIPITGTGVIPSKFPKLQITGLSGAGNRLNFGQRDTIGVAYTLSFTMINNPDTLATLTGIVTQPANSQFVVTSGAGAFSLDSGKSMNVSVTLTTTAIGPIQDSMFISSNDNVLPNFKIILMGSGVEAAGPGADTLPVIRLNRSVFNFGTIVQNANRQMLAYTISNTAPTAILVALVTSPSAPFSLASGGGASVINPGALKRDTVYFNTESVGTFNDSLVIISNTAEVTKRMVIPIIGSIISGSGVKESKTIEGIAAFPNPASSKVTVQLDLIDPIEIEASIFDMNGKQLLTYVKKIFDKGLQQFDVDCSELRSGSYFICLKASDGLKVLPITVQR